MGDVVDLVNLKVVLCRLCVNRYHTITLFNKTTLGYKVKAATADYLLHWQQHNYYDWRLHRYTYVFLIRWITGNL